MAIKPKMNETLFSKHETKNSEISKRQHSAQRQVCQKNKNSVEDKVATFRTNRYSYSTRHMSVTRAQLRFKNNCPKNMSANVVTGGPLANRSVNSMNGVLSTRPTPDTTGSALGNRLRSFCALSEPSATPMMPASTVSAPNTVATLHR